MNHCSKHSTHNMHCTDCRRAKHNDDAHDTTIYQSAPIISGDAFSSSSADTSSSSSSDSSSFSGGGGDGGGGGSSGDF